MLINNYREVVNISKNKSMKEISLFIWGKKNNNNNNKNRHTFSIAKNEMEHENHYSSRKRAQAHFVGKPCLDYIMIWVAGDKSFLL